MTTTSAPKLLGRDAILTADDLPFEDVDCPEWGGTVRIGSVSGAVRDDFEASIRKTAGKDQEAATKNLRARFVAACAIDEKGARIFADDDAHKLGMKSAKALDRCFTVASKLNGMSQQDEKDLVADFGDAQAAPSSSD